MEKRDSNYWFFIEPYVFIGITNKSVLLYNTLDGESIESDKIEIIELLQEIIRESNCGVVLLTHAMYKNSIINSFIYKIRNMYMGDIINTQLSLGKPVQIRPYLNHLNEQRDSRNKKSYTNEDQSYSIYEITIHIDKTISTPKLISFLKLANKISIFNIKWNITCESHFSSLMEFLNEQILINKFIYSYMNISSMQIFYENNFLHILSIGFPIEINKLEEAFILLIKNKARFECVFEVSSINNINQAELLIEKFKIEKYHLLPIYTGDNLSFLENNVFLTKNNILSSSLSIKDFFIHQSINIFDFGKINIMPNGDVYANIRHPVLGNVYKNSIYDLVYKEINEGKSWFNIRNQPPCTECVYQWLCPSPSDLEIAIGRPNLCHVNALQE